MLAVPLSEVGLRVVWPQPPRGFEAGLFERSEQGLTQLRANTRGSHYSREFHVQVASDARGYRAQVGVAPDARDGAVWCFGDSYLFGWGVSAEQVATAQLEQDCANFGMPGDGLEAYPARLAEALAEGAPRAVVFVLYDNDFSEFGSAAPASADPSIKQRLLGLHSVRLGGRTLDALGLSTWAANLGGYAALRAAVLQRDLWLHELARTAELEPALNALRAALARVPPGVPTHVVRVVPVYAAGGEASRTALDLLAADPTAFDFDRLGNTLRAVCAEAGASYRELRPTTAAEEGAWYFPFDLHLTPAGQAALAEVLRGALGSGR